MQGGFQHTDGDIQAGAHFAAEAGVVYGFGAEDAVVAVPVLTFLKALDVAPVACWGDVDHQRAVRGSCVSLWLEWMGGQGAGAARKGAPRAGAAGRPGPFVSVQACPSGKRRAGRIRDVRRRGPQPGCGASCVYVRRGLLPADGGPAVGACAAWGSCSPAGERPSRTKAHPGKAPASIAAARH